MPSVLASSSLFDVTGKVVVITGGGTGIGKMLAEGFIENGAKVYIVGRRGDVLDQAVKELNAFGASGKVYSVQGDIATKAGSKAIADQLADKEDHVDVLINNAGVQKPWRLQIQDHDDPDSIEKLIWEGVEDEDFDVTNSVNVNGAYFLTAALVPLLRKSDLPSVIIVSSVAAIANQRPVSTLTYGVSKAANVKLASMLAGRLAPLKIRVNTILPGTFATEVTADKDGNLLPGAYKSTVRAPLRRAGRKEDIFGPCLMLASRAGGYMTNAIISVDGGRNLNAGTDDGIRVRDEGLH